jgi:hypothetical protein
VRDGRAMSTSDCATLKYAPFVSEELSFPRDDPGSALDLAAAEVRVDRTDMHAMVEALALRLVEALPRMAIVRRHRVGGFRSKQTEVESIDIVLGDQRFELAQMRGGFECTRHTVVRGITLKREELPVAQWIQELVEEVTHAAALGEQARIALEGLVR